MQVHSTCSINISEINTWINKYILLYSLIFFLQLANIHSLYILEIIKFFKFTGYKCIRKQNKNKNVDLKVTKEPHTLWLGSVDQHQPCRPVTLALSIFTEVGSPPCAFCLQQYNMLPNNLKYQIFYILSKDKNLLWWILWQINTIYPNASSNH